MKNSKEIERWNLRPKMLLKSILSILLLSLNSVIFGQISLPKVFSDNMVLQREVDIPVWGNATPGKWVTVELETSRLSALTGNDGKWSLRLSKMNAGGPYKMAIYLEGETKPAISFENILIGDVWVASGQSNMEWQVQQAKDAAKEIKNANYPNIRFFNVPHDKKIEKQNDILAQKWQVCDSNSVKTASAVSYFYARKLCSDLSVPVGILQATWGGTPVEAWTSREQLLSSPITRERVLQNDTVTAQHFVKDSLDLIRFWDIVYKVKNNTDKTVVKISHNDAEWEELQMPKTFKYWGIPPYEGIVWLRKSVDIPSDMQAKELTIELGLPEMNYSLYFNGQEICKTVWNANLTHNYKLPANIVKEGKNIIAVRMSVLWGGGGFNLPAEKMYITDGTSKISLAGAWKYKKDLEPTIPKINNYHRYPTYLYNAMINPIIPYGIKGFIWYQGEDNVSEAYDYRKLFPMMIADWRIRWQSGYLPFYYVQLANYMKPTVEPSESNWAMLRESQTMTLNQPNTGMACIIDIGEENSIHPLNKQEVGRRLALIAKKMTYGKKVQASGPMYEGFEVDGNQIKIQFSETGTGLAVRNNGILKGFAIAGNDKTWYWADAKIEGNVVLVNSEYVENPVAVRYAWADNPVCNLINKEGLPAIPFRTDQW